MNPLSPMSSASTDQSSQVVPMSQQSNISDAQAEAYANQVMTPVSSTESSSTGSSSGAVTQADVTKAFCKSIVQNASMMLQNATQIQQQITDEYGSSL